VYSPKDDVIEQFLWLELLADQLAAADFPSHLDEESGDASSRFSNSEFHKFREAE
jgi:hypothetical protein